MDRRAKVKVTFLALLAVGAAGCARPAPSLSARSWLGSYYDGAHTRCYQPLLPRPGGGPLFVRWAGERANVLAGDVNGDSRIELVGYTGKRLEVRAGRTLQLLWGQTIEGTYNLALGDVDGQAGVEIVLAATETPSPHALVFDGSGRCLRRFAVARGVDRDGSGKWEGGTGEVTVTDLDGDGRGEVILKVDALYDQQPRGVYVYDGLTGREKWHYEIGPHPEWVAVGDVTGDGRPEMVLGTYAPANGHAANGTDDEHSYLIALTSTGQRLWQRELGTAFSGLVHCVSDLEEDGRPEIIAGTFVAGGFRNDQGRILILRGRDGQVLRPLPTPRSVGDKMMVGDLQGDGRPEIVFTLHGIRGFRVADSHLKPVGVCTQDVTPVALADVTGDSRREILAISRTAELVVFDSNLQEVDRHSFEPEGTGYGAAIVADLAGCGRAEVVAITSTGIRVLAGSLLASPDLGRRQTVARVGWVEHLCGSPRGDCWAFPQRNGGNWNLCLAEA
jgi:outer membrane protein assembly factor BamB